MANHSPRASNHHTVYRGDDQWKGLGVVFPTADFTCLRRKANDIGVWLRLRQVIRIRLLICSARLSTGVSDATAEEAYQILSLRHPTSLQCDVGRLQHMFAMDPGNRPVWAAFANHGESRLPVLRARAVWIPTAGTRSVMQIAEGSYNHIGGGHERLSML